MSPPSSRLSNQRGGPGRVALVTGGNRGIGLEICRQLAADGLEVILTARDPAAGDAAAAALRTEGHQVRTEQLDVADPASVTACAARAGPVDVLVNNAGTYPTAPLFSVTEQEFTSVLDVTVVGAFRTITAFVPGMARRGYGRVVNLSSGLGSMADGIPGPPAYGVAKAALNALTLATDAATPAEVKVNAVCPGWVRTDMGGRWASKSVAEGADTATWLATLPDSGPTGGFFRDRAQIPW